MIKQYEDLIKNLEQAQSVLQAFIDYQSVILDNFRDESVMEYKQLK